MCILITQNEMNKKYLDDAKRAGLRDEQLEAMIDLLRKIRRPTATSIDYSKFV